MDAQTVIAKRIALELRDGMLVNLGIGIPTQVANYVPAGIRVFFQSENGLIGTVLRFGPTSKLCGARPMQIVEPTHFAGSTTTVRFEPLCSVIARSMLTPPEATLSRRARRGNARDDIPPVDQSAVVRRGARRLIETK